MIISKLESEDQVLRATVDLDGGIKTSGFITVDRLCDKDYILELTNSEEQASVSLALGPGELEVLYKSLALMLGE